MRIGGGGGIGTRPHGQGGVCGRHREHTFCSPTDFLGNRRRRSCNLRHCLDGPPPEGEFLLLGMRDVVIRITAPRVAHLFDVERGADLEGRIYQKRGELNARKASFTGDEPHCSCVTEEAPPTTNVGVVISHGFLALLGYLAVASTDQIIPSSASAATDAAAPTALSRRLCLCC